MGITLARTLSILNVLCPSVRHYLIQWNHFIILPQLLLLWHPLLNYLWWCLCNILWHLCHLNSILILIWNIWLHLLNIVMIAFCYGDSSIIVVLWSWAAIWWYNNCIIVINDWICNKLEILIIILLIKLLFSIWRRGYLIPWICCVFCCKRSIICILLICRLWICFSLGISKRIIT